MYNRYVPQPDGTYRRSRIPDPPKEDPPVCCEPEQPSASTCPTPVIPCDKVQACPRSRPRPSRTSMAPKKPVSDSAGGFLKNLLPKDLDTSDLLIIALLLLMSGDCQEDQNTALLTLALYFLL